MSEMKLESVREALKRLGRDCYGVGRNRNAGDILLFLASRLEELDTDILEGISSLVSEASVIEGNHNVDITDFYNSITGEEGSKLYDLDDPDDENDDLHRLISTWHEEPEPEPDSQTETVCVRLADEAPADEPVQELIEESVQAPADEPVQELIEESVPEPADEPVQELIEESVQVPEVRAEPECEKSIVPTQSQMGQPEEERSSSRDMNINELPEFQPDWDALMGFAADKEEATGVPEIKDTVYADWSGTKYTPGDMLIEDIAGAIYSVKGNDQILIKIIKPEFRGNLSPILEGAMNLDAEARLDAYWVFSKPIARIFDSNSRCAGFILPKVDFELTLFELIWDPEKRKRVFPTCSQKSMIGIAYNFVHAVQYLHSKHIVIGDICSSDIVIAKGGSVCFIAPERFDIVDPKKVRKYTCDYKERGIDMPEMIRRAPEAEGAKGSPCFTERTDDFWLAQTLFSMLTGGKSVFCGSFGQNRNNIMVSDAGVPVFEDAKVMAFASGEIRALFRAAFANAANVSVRPTAAVWERPLFNLYTSM